jgi:transposase
MPAAYTRDLRERLLRATDAGLRDAEIARATGVSVRSLARWRATVRAGASLAPKTSPGPRRRLSAEQEQLLVAQVADRPDATLDEHRERLAAEYGLAISRATTGRILQRHRLTLKKRA